MMLGEARPPGENSSPWRDCQRALENSSHFHANRHGTDDNCSDGRPTRTAKDAKFSSLINCGEMLILLIPQARTSVAKLAGDMKVSTKRDRNRTQTDLDRLASNKMKLNRDKDSHLGPRNQQHLSQVEKCGSTGASMENSCVLAGSILWKSLCLVENHQVSFSFKGSQAKSKTKSMWFSQSEDPRAAEL